MYKPSEQGGNFFCDQTTQLNTCASCLQTGLGARATDVNGLFVEYSQLSWR